MRRAILIALALLALLSLVPSGSGRGRANEKTDYRWYKLTGSFTGRYTETGSADLTLSTTWRVRTDPFELYLERGQAIFLAVESKAPSRSTLQSAKLVYAVKGSECSSKTTYDQKPEPLDFYWFSHSPEPIPRGSFSDSSHGRTVRHCLFGQNRDTVTPERVSCANIASDSGYPYRECFVGGANDAWAQSFLGVKDDPAKATRALFRVPVPSGRLGHDFHFRTSLIESRKEKAARGGPDREDIHYVYSFQFHACPHRGLTKKGC